MSRTRVQIGLSSRRQVLRGAVSAACASAFPALVRAQQPDAVSAGIQADLEQHARFGLKRSATEGDLATAEWVARRLESAGFHVDAPDFPAPFLVERSVRLVSGGVSAAVHAQAPAKTTGPGGVSGRLAPMRSATDAAQARGKIAYIVLPFARHAALGRGDAGVGGMIRAAAAAGAKGCVIVTTGPTGAAVLLNCPEDAPVPVPTVILAPRDAGPFAEAAKEGAEARLVIDADATHRPSRNVVARLERGERWIGISTPRSGWFDCVGERGTGTAVFLALAQWAVERFPEHSVHLMNTGGHEYYFAGSHRVIGLAPPAAATDVWAHIGASLAVRAVDASGRMLDSADTGRSLMATANLGAAVAEGFAAMPELARAVPVRPEAGELSMFTDRGYRRCFAVLGLHTWFHTALDTIERVDGRLVAPVLAAHQRVIERAVEEARRS